MQMDLTIDNSGPFPVATLSGEWRATGEEGFQNKLHPLVAEAGARLVIDVSRLGMIDSSGLSELISVVTHARLARARVVLVAPSPFVAEVLETTNLNNWFEICADMEEAAGLLSEE